MRSHAVSRVWVFGFIGLLFRVSAFDGGWCLAPWLRLSEVRRHAGLFWVCVCVTPMYISGFRVYLVTRVQSLGYLGDYLGLRA